MFRECFTALPLRRFSTMATPYRAGQCSPFTQAVVNCMRILYPESLAEKSFDNTGLLLEAPWDPERRLNNSVLLTIDLTRSVTDEAIKRRDSIIIAYHPIIFRGLKSLTLSDPQQDSLLRLAREGISVYSPHTAVDAVPNGMADWLCDVVSGQEAAARSQDLGGGISRTQSFPAQQQDPNLPPPPLPPRQSTEPTVVPHTRTTIYPNPSAPEGFEGAGAGRLVTFANPQPLSSLVRRIASRTTGSSLGVPVALPQSQSVEDMTIGTVATCPGSGSSILLKSGMPAADLLLTGELSHHEALAATERGSAVISLFHSNSERGYLRSVMQQKLASALKEEWATVRTEMAETLDAGSKEMEHLLESEGMEVEVSNVDKDPYTIVSVGSETRQDLI